jgi:hypothetical protein
LTINFGDEVRTMVSSKADQAKLLNKVSQLRMFVRPSPGADPGPQRRFFWCRKAHDDPIGHFAEWTRHRLLKHGTQFDRPVSTHAQQIDGRDARQWTHFMHYRRAAIEEEALDRIQGCRSQSLKESKPEALRDGRVNSIEDGIGARTLDPAGPTRRIETSARFRKLEGRPPFSAFEAFCEF